MRASCLVLASTLLAVGLAPSGDARSQAVDAAPIAEATGQGKDVNIEADNMEVLDKSKQAIFTGNVNAERGGVTMKSNRLVVYYRSSAAVAPAARSPISTPPATSSSSPAPRRSPATRP
jgi:lipopolysaccharide export system protein LptA